MPGREIAGRLGGPQFTDALKAAVETGSIPVSAIDQALARILVQMDRFHLLDGKRPARPRAINVKRMRRSCAASPRRAPCCSRTTQARYH